MKSLAAFAVVAISAAMLAGCGNNITGQKFMGISGKPRSVKITTYDAVEKFGEVVEQDILRVELYEFDNAGGLQKMTAYDRDGDVVFSLTNKFEGGRWVGSELFENDNGTSSKSILLSGTKNSSVIQNTTSDGTVTTTNVEDSGKTKTIIEKDLDGKVISKNEQLHDDKGNLVELKHYGEDGEVSHGTLSTFDADSREITKKVWHGDYGNEYTYSYETVDAKGNWTKRIDRRDGEIESVAMRDIQY